MLNTAEGQRYFGEYDDDLSYQDLGDALLDLMKICFRVKRLRRVTPYNDQWCYEDNHQANASWYRLLEEITIRSREIERRSRIVQNQVLIAPVLDFASSKPKT